MSGCAVKTSRRALLSSTSTGGWPHKADRRRSSHSCPPRSVLHATGDAARSRTGGIPDSTRSAWRTLRNQGDNPSLARCESLVLTVLTVTKPPQKKRRGSASAGLAAPPLSSSAELGVRFPEVGKCRSPPRARLPRRARTRLPQCLPFARRGTRPLPSTQKLPPRRSRLPVWSCVRLSVVPLPSDII